MRKKRSSFWTLVFSLLPGAGHMFMGFMKLGLSTMALFFFIIFVSSWLNIGPLVFILPVLWFYSFFDCINKRYASDEEFARFEDHYLFSIDKLTNTNNLLSKKSRLIAGVVILLFGIYIIWHNFMNLFSRLMPDQLYRYLTNISVSIPQLIVGVCIIAIGVWLIIGKKKENDKNA
jgi:hypothetical protein